MHPKPQKQQKPKNFIPPTLHLQGVLENSFFSIANLINLTKILETQKKIAKFPKSQNLNKIKLKKNPPRSRVR
jgi:hypothetical protein